MLTASPSMPTVTSGRFLFLDPSVVPKTSPTTYWPVLGSKGRGKVVSTYGFWIWKLEVILAVAGSDAIVSWAKGASQHAQWDGLSNLLRLLTKQNHELF